MPQLIEEIVISTNDICLLLERVLGGKVKIFVNDLPQQDYKEIIIKQKKDEVVKEIYRYICVPRISILKYIIEGLILDFVETPENSIRYMGNL